MNGRTWSRRAPVVVAVAALAMGSVAFALPVMSRGEQAAEPSREQARVVMRGQRFNPARVELMVGDSVRFELESGAPHNVVFDQDSIPPGALAQLARNLGTDPRNLFTPDMLLIPGESFVLSLAGLPPGRYPFFCAPHYGGGMRGELVVRARTP